VQENTGPSYVANLQAKVPLISTGWRAKSRIERARLT